MAINRIDCLFVHGNDVPLIAAAIDTETNNVASQNLRRQKLDPSSEVLDFICWLFLLISLLGSNLKFKSPRKGLT